MHTSYASRIDAICQVSVAPAGGPLCRRPCLLSSCRSRSSCTRRIAGTCLPAPKCQDGWLKCSHEYLATQCLSPGLHMAFDSACDTRHQLYKSDCQIRRLAAFIYASHLCGTCCVDHVTARAPPSCCVAASYAPGGSTRCSRCRSRCRAASRTAPAGCRPGPSRPPGSGTPTRTCAAILSGDASCEQC